MSVLVGLLVISMIISGGFLIAFLWSSKNGQFEDQFSSATRILFEEKIKTKNKN
ncbi:MAG TPA: cbb3-type cytochrome oxidase assembly protein CcoS [Saprospiraceae bacterium]|nr:cbb3-type cytochrome oxidase assembly protein CcoS [Saprospiraceae bacterium]